MSQASKLTLLGTSLLAVGTVFAVHFQQKSEKEVSLWPASIVSLNTALSRLIMTSAQAMHEGVVRDMEQQRIKRERQLDFDMQKQLEAEFKREQTVHDSIAAAEKGLPNR
jgi:protein PET117